MRDRYIEPTPACPVRSASVAPECKNCTGRVQSKMPFFFGGSTYFAVAILTEESDGAAEQVFEYSGPGCKRALVLCGPGSKLSVSLMRDKPSALWYVGDIKVVG